MTSPVPSEKTPATTETAIAIEVCELGKVYHPQNTLWNWLAAGNGEKAVGQTKGAVAALSGVSFSVRRGEAFGIIGRNGAGKSTLLQILAGTLKPSSGSFRLHGRVTALLELGSGFNPEFTGRENIYLAGSILGINRAEMDRKIDDIEAFADIGAFINAPAKTYSTGMLMRVAFAVAVAVDPEILIVDEALSVGDILFQQKCSIRLREMLAKGVTLLLVTHDTGSVLSLCQRAIWLDKGKPAFLGDASSCVRAYLTAMGATVGNEVQIAGVESVKGEKGLPTVDPLSLEHCKRSGDGGVAVERVWLQNDKGEATSVFRIGEWCRLTLLLRAKREVRLVSGGCELRNRHGQVLFATGLRVVRQLIDRIPAGGTRLVEMRFKIDLAQGQYTLDVGTGAGEQQDNTWQKLHHVSVLEITTVPEQDVVHGLVKLPYEVASFKVRE